MNDPGRHGDVGLLAPVWAGSAAARLLDDTAVLQAMLDVERTWVQMCLDAGLGAGSCAASDPWAAQHYDLASIAARTPQGGNPLIPLLADLRAALGEGPEAGVVHLGATSQDVLDSALMLLAARAIDDALPRLDAACEALAALAREHRGTLCVARSLGQHALPYLFGLRAARWLDGLSQATADLRAVRAGLPLQWVGAAGTGAALTAHLRRAGPSRQESTAQLRAGLADRLGLLDSPGWHTNRLPITRLAGALSGVLVAAGTLATDVVTGSRNEIGELAEPSGPGRGGSSAMPHKRNPVLSLTIRSAALRAPGLLATLTTAAGLAADERPDGAWHAEWPALRELLRLAGGVSQTLAELTDGLTVDPAALRRNLDASVPAVLAEWAGITEDDPADLRPEDYLGESVDLIDAILRAHGARRAVLTTPQTTHPLDQKDTMSQPTTGPTLTTTQLSEPGTPEHPKPLLLLGASLGTDTQVLWERVARLLADRVHLVAWDLPGHGRSPAATADFTVADLADEVATLARRIDAPAGRYYAGVSLGGAVGLELGLRHAGLFGGIAVICSGAVLGTPDSWRERAAAVRVQGTSSLVTASAGRWFAPGWLDSEATLGGRLLDSLTQADDESYARCCEALAGHDVTARLPGITDPLLAINGEVDAVAPPALAAQMSIAAPNGRRLTAIGVAHLAPAEDPRFVTDALADLLGLSWDDPASPQDSRSGAAVPSATLAQLYDAGMTARREVLGASHVDTANASIDDVTRDFQEFITRYAWGSIWTRPGLDRVTRSAITLTAMIAGGHHEELAMHVRAARRNGMAREQIVEVLLQSAVYCSVPSANTAFKIARDVLADEPARTTTPTKETP